MILEERQEDRPDDNGKDDNPYTDTSAKGQEADGFCKEVDEAFQPPVDWAVTWEVPQAVKTNKAAPNNPVNFSFFFTLFPFLVDMR